MNENIAAILVSANNNIFHLEEQTLEKANFTFFCIIN